MSIIQRYGGREIINMHDMLCVWLNRQLPFVLLFFSRKIAITTDTLQVFQILSWCSPFAQDSGCTLCKDSTPDRSLLLWDRPWQKATWEGRVCFMSYFSVNRHWETSGQVVRSRHRNHGLRGMLLTHFPMTWLVCSLTPLWGHPSRGGTTHGGLGPSHQSFINQANSSLPLGNLMETLSQLKFLFPKDSSLGWTDNKTTGAYELSYKLLSYKLVLCVPFLILYSPLCFNPMRNEPKLHIESVPGEGTCKGPSGWVWGVVIINAPKLP